MWHAHGAVGPKREGSCNHRSAVWPKTATQHATPRLRDARASSPMVRVVWLVEEDDRGRWREFPEWLAANVEEEYQQWLNEPWSEQFWYSYEWTVKNEVVQYEIQFHRPMAQAKRTRLNERTICTMEQEQRGE